MNLKTKIGLMTARTYDVLYLDFLISSNSLKPQLFLKIPSLLKSWRHSHYYYPTTTTSTITTTNRPSAWDVSLRGR